MFKLPGKLNKCLGAPIARYLSESAVATEKEIGTHNLLSKLMIYEISSE